jgi:hypothetical protein
MPKREIDSPAKIYDAAKRAGEKLVRGLAFKHSAKAAGEAYAASVRRNVRTFPTELAAIKATQAAQSNASLSEARRGIMDGGVPAEGVDAIEADLGGRVSLLWIVQHYSEKETIV